MGTPNQVNGIILPDAAADRRPAGKALAPSTEAFMEKTSNVTLTWLDCNASDLDLCDMGDGSTLLFWTWGHQGTDGGLVRGTVPLPLDKFLSQWFEE